MKKFIQAAGVLVGAAMFASVSPLSAREYPVCVQGLYRAGGEGDSIRCEYDNFAQCNAARLGMAATCMTNPLYAGSPVERKPGAKRRHR